MNGKGLCVSQVFVCFRFSVSVLLLHPFTSTLRNVTLSFVRRASRCEPRERVAKPESTAHRRHSLAPFRTLSRSPAPVHPITTTLHLPSSPRYTSLYLFFPFPLFPPPPPLFFPLPSSANPLSSCLLITNPPLTIFPTLPPNPLCLLSSPSSLLFSFKLNASLPLFCPAKTPAASSLAFARLRLAAL